ncbi:MAG: hypothetical protein HY298_06830 [Verrucomicrobia bacterium]|nr:hypothetical protein [Verrucomicrobiota bacterium]
MADLIVFLQSSIPATCKTADPNRERDFGTLPGLIEPGGETLSVVEETS